MKRPDLRTVPRYFLNPPLDGSANSSVVRLVDLSVKGARMELTEPLPPGGDTLLVIAAPGGEITVAATVLWCEIDTLPLDGSRDRYLAGLAFAHPSAAVEELLDVLCGRDLASRIEDFRSHDRYRVTAPLTGSFGEIAPVSLLDLSIRGARIATEAGIVAGDTGQLRFQVDDQSGPIDVRGEVMWTGAPKSGVVHAGLLITGEDESLRFAIHRLCLRGEARIDLESLRRKFDQMRGQAAGMAACVIPSAGEREESPPPGR
ncbi:MAG TPA: PilZ domain-containing protein [Thermoanaerobaculia bacterium]|nr:PilZ domain-containing protein [Thermoanaerobaculia bacterium]